MSFLRNVFGRRKSEVQTEQAPPPPCAHISLVARWDSVEDMGRADKATRYVCEACGESFAPEVARAKGIEQWQRPA